MTETIHLATPTLQRSNKPEKHSAGRVKPTGLLVTCALLALVGYQTIQLDRSPSFHRVASTASLSSMTAKTGANYVPSRTSSTTRVPIPLTELTQSSAPASRRDQCNREESKVWIDNQDAIVSNRSNQRIPFYIHQTSKSRCMHHYMANIVESKWRNLTQYDYLFHDDEAVWRLLNREWPEFPHLQMMLRCLKSMTAVSDIWRLLVLWEYGGIYVDLDAVPNSWTPAMIHPDDDSYFVVEYYDALSQYFMAASPRHPLMYHTIQQALAKIMNHSNNLKIDASLTTGPFALLDGFTTFMLENGSGKKYTKPVVRGLYYGHNNRSVRIDGFGRNQSSDIIDREAYGRNFKIGMYAEMNMTHFLQDKRRGRTSGKMGRSCLAIAHDVTLGPPDWYVASEKEDRETVGGTS